MITPALQITFFWLVHLPLRFLLRAKVDVHPEALTASSPVLLVANHDWRFDPFLLALLPWRVVRRWIPFAFPTGEYFQERTLLWRCLRLMGAFRVPRLAWSVETYLEGTTERLARGDTILMFPEGRVSSADAPRRAKRGVGYLVLRSTVTVVPLRIRVRGGRAAITVGAPMQAGELAKGDPAAVAQRILDAIEAL